MRFKMFCFSKHFFSWSWKIDPEQVQSTISYWLSQNQGCDIREIRHNTVASIWYPPQLFVSVYYEDSTSRPAAPTMR